MFSSVPIRKASVSCFGVAIFLFAPEFAVSQIDTQIARTPGNHQIENSSDHSLVRRELEKLQAELRQHPQEDVLRAWLLTDLATLQSRLGSFIAAQQSSRAVLSMPVRLPPECSGVNHFVLANALNLLGSEAESEREYLEAANEFSAAGPGARVRLALSYAELAMIYLHRQDLQAAERCLQKSLGADSAANDSPSLYVTQVDTGAHIALTEGRLTDAFNRLSNLFEARGNDGRVDSDLRAHIARDLAEICAESSRFNGAVIYLNKAADLQERNGDLGQAAVSIAMLGSIETFRKAPAAASEAFRRAEMLLEASRSGNPLEASMVHAYHGIYLVSQNNWGAGADSLRDALEAGKSTAGFAPIRRKCLTSLLTADRHLRNKIEAKQIRTELKREVEADKPQATVDLMSLKRAMR